MFTDPAAGAGMPRGCVEPLSEKVCLLLEGGVDHDEALVWRARGRWGGYQVQSVSIPALRGYPSAAGGDYCFHTSGFESEAAAKGPLMLFAARVG